MCMFCAAIPAALALGANGDARERRKAADAEQRGLPPNSAKVKAKTVAALAAGGLAMASLIYHTQSGG